MAQSVERARHDTSVTMRMPQQTKALIETAAISAGKSFSAFVIDSARREAVDVLLDQRVFSLDADAAEAFAQVLENPPKPSAKLRRLMASRSPWE